LGEIEGIIRLSILDNSIEHVTSMEIDKSQIALTLLFDTLPILDRQQMAETIAAIEPVST
jgi:hypothetical protein